MMGDNGAAVCSKAKAWVVAIERDGRFYFKYSWRVYLYRCYEERWHSMK